MLFSHSIVSSATSPNGLVMMRHACIAVLTLQGRNKKDARQVAAAACVEALLKSISPADFFAVKATAPPKSNPKAGVSAASTALINNYTR